MVTDFIPERKAMAPSACRRACQPSPGVCRCHRALHDLPSEHPSVGAILHIHAWMPDIASTHINFPCGTIELATTVADLVRPGAPIPATP